ncbi:hypothetical protein EON66_09755, partial [archaeon]
SIIDPATADNVDLNNVKVVKALGGTIDETELVHGLVFTNRVSHMAGAPTKVANAKIGLIQFCLSAPKTDIEVRRERRRVMTTFIVLRVCVC